MLSFSVSNGICNDRVQPYMDDGYGANKTKWRVIPSPWPQPIYAPPATSEKDHRLQYKIRILYPVTLLLEDLSTEYVTLGAKIVSLVVLIKAFPSGAWSYVAWICFTKRL